MQFILRPVHDLKPVLFGERMPGDATMYLALGDRTRGPSRRFFDRPAFRERDCAESHWPTPFLTTGWRKLGWEMS